MRQNQSEHGIALITLVIIIIIILIIAGVVIYKGASVLEEAKFEDIKTNMLLIEAKAKVILEDKKIDDTVQLIGSQEKPDDLQTESTEDLTEYYYLSAEDLETMDLGNIVLSDGEYYLVKYDLENLQVEVFYTLGVQNSDGIMYYKLSEM